MEEAWDGGLEERVTALEKGLADHLETTRGRAATVLALTEVVSQLVRERDTVGRAIEAMAEKFTKRLPADKRLRELLRKARADVDRVSARSAESADEKPAGRGRASRTRA